MYLNRKFLNSFCLTIIAVVIGASMLAHASSDTFRNPILQSGADPWVITYNGNYYYMDTTGKNLILWKTKDITDLRHANKRVIWKPPTAGPYSHDIWAPELHHFDNKWYVYFAADGGDNRSHRLYVLENASSDPIAGNWIFEGQITDTTDKWAIDPTAFENAGQKYLIWSGWEGDKNGVQNIYIAQMSNPLMITSARSLISSPKYPWERVNHNPGNPNNIHVAVNEGPEILQHGRKIFLIYSASGCWTDAYSLGVLEADSHSDLLNPQSWKKFDHPFFSTYIKNGVYGPGHNGFFKSLDGKEDWIIYHANPESGDGCGRQRSPRIQQFTWNADGTPNFGSPVSTNTFLAKPSH
jgi:GH43 family beta-xylosidase